MTDETRTDQNIVRTIEIPPDPLLSVAYALVEEFKNAEFTITRDDINGEEEEVTDGELTVMIFQFLASNAGVIKESSWLK